MATPASVNPNRMKSIGTVADYNGRSKPALSERETRTRVSRESKGGNIESSMSTRRPVLVERAALVGLVTGGARRVDAEHSLEELTGLAEAAGARVVLRVLQDRPKPDPATFLGSGKVEVLAHAAAEADADLVIFDNELSPAQLRELNKRLDRKVVDRTQLILDIFARRAHPGRQAAGRARAIEVPVAAAGRVQRSAVAARRRHRHQGSRRNETRSG